MQLRHKDEKLIGKYYIYDKQPVTFENFTQHLWYRKCVFKIIS